MKKILGLISSQRKLGNGEILVKAAVEAIEEDCQLELIRLPDLNLKPCKGCYSCLTPGNKCVIKDDLYFLVEKLKEADGIIFSAPCYALGPAGITKLLGDRILAFSQFLDDFWEKPCVVIGTVGIEGWEGYTLSALTGVARFLGFAVKDAQMFLGALPGEALSETGKKKVQELGRSLFGTAREPKEGECPTCWSEIWKFPQPNQAICPLCGQTAALKSVSDGLHWEFGEPGQRLGYENLKHHFQSWLRGKVEEYIAQRKELAIIRNPYKNQGTWLIP